MTTMMWYRLGSIFMFTSVALGAFGAHALKNKISPAMQVVFETGVRYQVYHALGLFVVGWLSEAHPNLMVNGAGWAFVTGILLFSGSLYVLSLSGISWIGAITPIGGMAFLIGWGLLIKNSV
jgi:uncharacterized membrane protein YgdD (TMEM256/DUF423 family)